MDNGGIFIIYFKNHSMKLIFVKHGKECHSMGNTYKSGNHNKYLLQYHLIFVCKYRHKLLSSPNIASDAKRLSVECCQNHNVVIHYVEVDKDHIHYMIETTPNINLSNLVKTMKSYITYHIWGKTNCLSKCFWKEKTFSSDGYFISSIDNISPGNIKEIYRKPRQINL
jgi:putative transposase